MRHQFVLDKKSNSLLDELAESRDGNRSRVVREAILMYAEREAYLDKIESDPKFIDMMERSEADFRAGRVFTHEQVGRHLARKSRRR